MIAPTMGAVAEELTIDALAREAGMTVRNIRAYQSRGLLPPPEVRARTGFYGPDHVARLKLIADMRAEGLGALPGGARAPPAGSRRRGPRDVRADDDPRGRARGRAHPARDLARLEHPPVERIRARGGAQRAADDQALDLACALEDGV